jgi:hypothetical protein
MPAKRLLPTMQSGVDVMPGAAVVDFETIFQQFA